jgi:glucokinase
MEKLLCGVDLGGTKLSVALFTREGEQVDKLETKEHAEKDNDGITADVIASVEELLSNKGMADTDLLGIGIGVAAHIRFEEGLVITSSNFKAPFKNYPMRERVQSQFKVPVILDNDANAQTYGEFRFGAGRGRRDVIFMTVSTGIGAGIVINGNLVRGVTGTAGEIGHTIIKYDSQQMCTCGNKGCLMAHSSGLFFPSFYKSKLEEGKKSLLGITPKDVAEVDGLLIAKGLRVGDEICTEIFYESARIVGVGVYNLFQILNPEIVIIGGGLMNLGPPYLEEIKKTFHSLVKDMMYDRMQIVLAELGVNSGLVGASALPLEQT